jgi:hypothetical protein
MTEKHAPEPWEWESFDLFAGMCDAEGNNLQHAYEGEIYTENVERIVTCVNFCQGISNTTLKFLTEEKPEWLKEVIKDWIK